MARKKRQDGGGSLDSLLDTMTNVVGILVIVLIVTQLNVAEALKRIQSNLPQVSQEDVEILKAVVDENRKSLDKLETTWTELEPEKQEEEQQLDQLILQIDDRTENNEELVKENSDIEDLKKQIAELKEKVDAEAEVVTTVDEELQKLKAALDETPDREVLPPKIVHLPNPRPAPENAEPRFVVCKNNKAYYIGDVYEHLFKVRDFIEDNFEKLVYRGPGKGSYTYTLTSATKKNDQGRPDSVRNREGKPYQMFRYDPKKLQDFFEKGKYGGTDLWYQVSRAAEDNDYAALKIAFKEEGGQTVEQFKQRNSPLDLAFKKTQVDRNYIMFYVAPDSFDAYLEARQMAEFYNIPAGWNPWTSDVFIPTTKVPLQETTVELEDLPIAAIEGVAKALTPIVEENLTVADKEAAAKRKEAADEGHREAIEKWRKSFEGWANAVKTAPAAAKTMRGAHQVTVFPNAPNIPHIRIFQKVGGIPAKGPEPAPPKTAPQTKKDTPKPKRDTLD